MSLKVFHILFINCAIILSFVFGNWAIKTYFEEGKIDLLILGILSVGLAVGLVVYEYAFIKKMRKLL